MSIRVMAHVWADSRASGSALIVLLAIADNANDDGVAWPSEDTIATKARLSRRHVIRVVKQLSDAGELEVWRRREGRSTRNIYRVGIHPPGQDVTVNGAFTVTSEPFHGDIAMSHEPSGTVIKSNTLASSTSSTPREDASAAPKKAKAKPRPPDVLWDTLVELFGGSPTGRTERASWNAALRSLRESGATPDSLRAAAKTWPAKYEHATMTPFALAKHWTILTGHPKTAVDFRNDEIRALVAEREARWAAHEGGEQ